MNLTIVNRSGRAIPRKFLQTWVRSVEKEMRVRVPRAKLSGRELVIAFVTRSEIQRLNRAFRGKNKPTDVLSFEGESDESLGELAISPEVISVQAGEHGLLVREEMGYMILHGILHLLGYDHERGAREAKKMFALQDAIFESLVARHGRC
jgi:probable rRNA maturation factor